MTETLDADARIDRFALPRPAVRRARTAEDRAVEAFVMHAYDEHARDLHAFARALVREPEAAEDLVADAYLRLLREAREGRAPDDVRGWLYRVTSNLVLSRGRRIATARRFLSQLVDRRVERSPEAGLMDRVVRPDLLYSLAGLPADQRVAIVMASRGASGREIAQAIGRSEAATRTLLTRARQRLRERLGDRPAHPDGGDR